MIEPRTIITYTINEKNLRRKLIDFCDDKKRMKKFLMFKFSCALDEILDNCKIESKSLPKKCQRHL